MLSDSNGLGNLGGTIGGEAFAKRRRRRRRTRTKKQPQQQLIVFEALDEVTDSMLKEEKQVKKCQHPEKVSREKESSVLETNSVLRKLLRRTRYFDPPADSFWLCRNCGLEGHRENNCVEPRRRKPCFVCGTFEHTWRRCKLRRNCFSCKGRGHIAKHCPETNQEDNTITTDVCLRCGDSGHDMFSCLTDYCVDDLKEIKCYVCKSFGHLCCVHPAYAEPICVSCYYCGQSGHLGSGCMKTCEDTHGSSPRLCAASVEGNVILQEIPKLCEDLIKTQSLMAGEDENIV